MFVAFFLGVSVGLGGALGIASGGYLALDLLGRCPRCVGRIQPHPPATARQLARARRAQRLRVEDAK